MFFFANNTGHEPSGESETRRLQGVFSGFRPRNHIIPRTLLWISCDRVTGIMYPRGNFHMYPVTRSIIYWKYENTRHRPKFFGLFERAVRIETIEFVLIQNQHQPYRRSTWGRTNRRTKYIFVLEVKWRDEMRSKNLVRLFSRYRVTDGRMPTL